jgi:hypothetical protein
LRHADARNDARRADRARPDADLDRVRTGIDQRLGAFFGRNVARDDLAVVAQLLDRTDRAKHALAVAMRGVDHDHVTARLQQRFGTANTILTDTGGGGDAQPTLLILAGVRVLVGLFDILDRDQPDAVALVIHNQQLLDPVLVEEPAGLVAVDALLDGHQTTPGHQFAHGLVRIGREADVAVGQDTDQPVAPLGDHGNSRYPVIGHQLKRVGERLVRLDRDRIHDHTRFEPLDPADLHGLALDLQILVDHTDTAGLRHGYGEPRLRDRIHGRRDERDAEFDRFGQSGAGVGLVGQDFGRSGLQQDIVECQTLNQFHRSSPVRKWRASYTGFAVCQGLPRHPGIVAHLPQFRAQFSLNNL